MTELQMIESDDPDVAMLGIIILMQKDKNKALQKKGLKYDFWFYEDEFGDINLYMVYKNVVNGEVIFDTLEEFKKRLDRDSWLKGEPSIKEALHYLNIPEKFKK